MSVNDDGVYDVNRSVSHIDDSKPMTPDSIL